MTLRRRERREEDAAPSVNKAVIMLQLEPEPQPELQPLIRREISSREMAETHRERLLAEARAAQLSAYAPYSNFSVGAALLTADGTVYHGCNVENASFGLTTCAERVAIFSAIAAGHMDIVAVAVITSAPRLCKPCGACRQVLIEFSQRDNPIMVLSATTAGESSLETITDLLPDNFTLL